MRSAAWSEQGFASSGSAGRTGTIYKVSIEYVYLVDGEYYCSNRIRLIDNSGSAFST
jgi:hypothetical protein